MAAESQAFLALRETAFGGGRVEPLEGDAWRLCLPAGPAAAYRLAQLDDIQGLPRRHLLWRPPCELTMDIRVSGDDLPGTWGFGFWNDPFSVRSIQTAGARLIPALPQCAWFFSASPPNHLSIYDDVPANGFFSGGIRSRRIPVWALLPGLIGLPLLAFPAGVRLLRRLGRWVVQQEGTSLTLDPTQWHTYQLLWQTDKVTFNVDGVEISKIKTSPPPPLGLVIWIDNQYAAVTPQGKIRSGVLANPECWMEVRLQS